MKHRLIEIAQIVAEYYGYTLDELKAESRIRMRAEARFMFYRLARDYAEHYTLSSIGDVIRRHHSTVISGLTSLESLLFTSKSARRIFKVLQEKVDALPVDDAD